MSENPEEFLERKSGELMKLAHEAKLAKAIFNYSINDTIIQNPNGTSRAAIVVQIQIDEIKLKAFQKEVEKKT